MSGSNFAMELPVPEAVIVTPNGQATRIFRTYLQILSARTGGSAGQPSLTTAEVNALIAAGLAPEIAARISGDSTNAAAVTAAVTAEATTRAANDLLRLLLTGGTLTGPLTAPQYRTTVYTVATLPAAVASARAFVNDALAPAFGAAVVGAGAVSVPVYYDGAVWKVG